MKQRIGTAIQVNVAAVFCCSWLMAGQPSQPALQPLANVRRIFVDQFTVKKDPGKLRSNVITELRKLSDITVVSDAAHADAILAGEGEIWVKGYQSLNARSGRLPSDGVPYYSGFLSIELKDVHGDTLWSYLVTPEIASANIGKELSKEVEKHLADALARRAASAKP